MLCLEYEDNSREVHKRDIKICFNVFLLYDQVLLTRCSQVHVCCKLVTCDSAFPYMILHDLDPQPHSDPGQGGLVCNVTFTGDTTV